MLVECCLRYWWDMKYDLGSPVWERNPWVWRNIRCRNTAQWFNTVRQDIFFFFSLHMCTLMYLIGHCSGFPSRIRLHGGAKVEPGSMSFHAGLKSVWRYAEGREMLAGRSNNSETPLPPTTFQCQIRGRLYPTFSLTSWNRQSNIHTHFTLWLGSCAKLRREPAFELLSECNTEWLPGETVLI